MARAEDGATRQARRLVTEMRAEGRRVLCVTRSVADFERWREPGADTILATRQPWLVPRAMALSAGVVTWERSLFEMARALGCPAVVPGATTKRETGAGLARRLPPRQATLEPPPPNFAFRVAAVACRRYLASLAGLLDNLLYWGAGPLTAHLCLLDPDAERWGERWLSASFPEVRFRFHRPRDLWGRRAKETLLRGSAIAAFSAKAPLLLRALREEREAVFYCDVDLLFLRSPDGLLARFGEAHTLLFPHWNDSLPNESLHGMFNAGLVGARPGAEQWLSWWKRLCLSECRLAPERGWFVDQGYLSLVPLHFDGIAVDRRRDENVGPWSARSLGARPLPGPFPRGRTRGGPLGSFHASQPDARGLYAMKIAWDQVASLRLPAGAGQTDRDQAVALAAQGSLSPALDAALAASRKARLPASPRLFSLLMRPLPAGTLAWIRRLIRHSRPEPAWVAEWIGWQRRSAASPRRPEERRIDATDHPEPVPGAPRRAAVHRPRRKRPLGDALGVGKPHRGV